MKLKTSLPLIATVPVLLVGILFLFTPQQVNAEADRCLNFDYVVEEHPEGGTGRWAETQGHWVYIETNVDQFNAGCTDIENIDYVNNTRWDYDPQSSDDELVFLPSETFELTSSVIRIDTDNYTNGEYHDNYRSTNSIVGIFDDEPGVYNISINSPGEDALNVLEGNPPGTTPDPTRGEEEESAGENGAECEAEGIIGLLSCDIMMFILEKIKDLQEWIVELLFETDPLVVDGTDNPVYLIWSNIRNVANALLAVAFMAIIFSLALSVNVDAYTIKRLVPKLLVAAVAIQASYLLSGLMVDVTNILGQGLQGLTDVTLNNLDVDENWGVEGRVGSTAASGAFIALIGAGTLVAIPVLAPIFLFLFLVILGAFLIVAIRDVFIIFFVVLSPVFFLANLLPATEKWFKFWWSNFARLLLMYPFMILMIQVANMAAIITLADAGAPADFSTGPDERVQNFLKPFMAIIMQFLGILSIYFAFRVGGSVLSLATQGLSQMRRGGGGGKGGGSGQGLTGKIKSGVKNRQREYATGSRGNKFTQALTSPKGSYARSQSKLTPGGRPTAAQNVSSFNAQVGENAKALETEGHDPKTLKAFAEVGGSQHGLNSRIKELRSSGKEEEAKSLAAMAHHGGNRSMQAAAAKQAASKGNVDDSTFEALKKSFGDDTVLSKHVRGDVARGAKDAGRPDLFAKHNAEGKKPEDVIRGMSAKDMAEMKADALGKVDDNGNWKRSEFGEALSQGAQPGNPEYETLKAALSPANGMAADRRAAIANTIGQDKYGPIMKQAESGQRSGGGESYVVDANTPNATGSNEAPSDEPRPSGRGDNAGYINPDDPNSTAS